MRVISGIIIHCSDSDIKKHDDISIIREWHIQRGFNDVGYQIFIKKNGVAQLGRPVEKIGAHCRGENNYTIGICLSGRSKFTKKQIKEAAKWVKHYMAIFELGSKDVYGHNEFNSKKTCPNIDMTEFRGLLN